MEGTIYTLKFNSPWWVILFFHNSKIQYLPHLTLCLNFFKSLWVKGSHRELSYDTKRMPNFPYNNFLKFFFKWILNEKICSIFNYFSTGGWNITEPIWCTLYSSRAFQSDQECDKRHCGFGRSQNDKQTKQTTFPSWIDLTPK